MPQITMPQTLSFSKGADQGISYFQSKVGVPLSWALWIPKLAIVSFIATKELALYALPTACFFLANYITRGKIKPLDNVSKFVTKSYVEIAKFWVRSAVVVAGVTFVGLAFLAGLIHLAAIKVGLVPSPLNNNQPNNNQLGSLNDILRNMGFRITGNAQNPVQLRTNDATGQDKQYQEHLIGLVKRGVKDVLENEILSGYLDLEAEEGEDPEKGVDRIADLDADAISGVANYIQLLEIEGDITCPEAFEHNTREKYNTRRKEIEEIKKELEKLSDKTKLKEVLIKSNFGDLEKESLEYKIGLRISALAGDLHQGQLMSVAVLSVVNFENSSESFFLKAWQDAVQEHKNPN